MPDVSGSLESWGQPGPGRWITVYANSTHAFITIAGRAFDTAHYGGPDLPAGPGPRWRQNPTGNLADGLATSPATPPAYDPPHPHSPFTALARRAALAGCGITDPYHRQPPPSARRPPPRPPRRSHHAPPPTAATRPPDAAAPSPPRPKPRNTPSLPAPRAHPARRA